MANELSSILLFLLALMSFSALLSAENLTVTPAKCFLQGNQTVILNWRYHSKKLIENYFDKNFMFFHDGTKLENEGGGATMVLPDKPYVNYELTVKKPGSYMGKVDSVNTTALVYTVESEANLTSAARSGFDLNLTCVDGPEGTVILWEVDGVPVDEEKYRENYDGSLTVKKIDLPGALRKIRCRMFFTSDDCEEYKKNKSNVPGYKMAVVKTPVLVYNTSRHSESESLFILQVATSKHGITVCGQKNSSDFCKNISVNISSVELDRYSNFTINMNQILLVTDIFKDEPVDSEKSPDSDGPSTAVVVVCCVVATLLVIGVVAAAIYHICRKHQDKKKSGDAYQGSSQSQGTPSSLPLMNKTQTDDSTRADDVTLSV